MATSNSKTKKKAAKKSPVKKAATAKTPALKVPFYAHLLTKQDTEKLKATNKTSDSLQTEKYPNDTADVVYKKEAGNVFSFPGAATSARRDQVVITLKFPSDNDEALTLKYPSDKDEIILSIEAIKKASLRTTRYPSDEYAVAVETLGKQIPIKAGVRRPISGPITDILQTQKFPSDSDEEIINF